MKKIVTIIFIVVGFVIAWGTIGRAESDMTFPMINLVIQTFAGFMVMGMGVAIARWK